MLTVPIVLAAVLAAASDPARLLTLGSRPDVEYGADCVMETEAGRVASKVWFARGKERRQMALATGTVTVITRVDRDVVWTLRPERSQYEETPIVENVTRAPRAGEVPPFDVERKGYAGDEVVAGMPCAKTKVTLTDRSNGAKLDGYLCTTRDDILVKAEAVGGGGASVFRLELSNVTIGDQPDELFEPPAGYLKVIVPPVEGVFRPRRR